MEDKNNKKKDPWRIIVGIISIAVSLIKVAVIAGGILLIKWAIHKFKNK